MQRITHLTSILFCLLLLGFSNAGYGQQLGIKSFAIFSTDSTRIESNVGITGRGLVGGRDWLNFKDTIGIDGDVYANFATFGNTFHLSSGSMFLLNTPNVGFNVLTAGTLINLDSPGNLIVKGNVLIDTSIGGIIQGFVKHRPGDSYQGPNPAGGFDTSAITFPTMPVLPAPATFPPVGGTAITGTTTITPGSYGGVVMPTQTTLTFSGVGTYVFDSIANATADTFKFDFQNNATGVIRIYVYGNANLGNGGQVYMVNGGSASRIYTEVHGTGLSIPGNNASFLLNTGGVLSSSWLGTIYATNSSVQIGSPNFTLNTFDGSIWSGKTVIIGRNTAFHYTQLAGAADPVPPSDILPYYPPPADGKTNTIIGSELTSLFENKDSILTDSIIYQIKGDSVLIEIIPVPGQYNNALTFLQANGLTNIISNGVEVNLITGQFPIDNLLLLNSRSDIIAYVRPLYFPITSVGAVSSQGDTAMRSNLVRAGYNLSGRGVKVGVISDSYNTLGLGVTPHIDYAALDVANGDLPNDVEVVADHPTPRTDEGRAMLQLVHDVAPDAHLAFRTGTVSSGDFVSGIRDLQLAGCNVIVDDVTYITEPFFTDGRIAQAVDNVVSDGISYFSAAGNFGKRSYEGAYSAMAPPAGLSTLTGTVHNFGSGNPLQTLNLLPGVYTIVLQWEDQSVSEGSSIGAQTDLDIYLLDHLGSTLFGFNRPNIGTDPIEVLPFTVTDTTTANLIISKVAGPDVNFKYIVFRGLCTIEGYNGSSTLVGQANSDGAIAVGAVLYTNTPTYGHPPTIASFSSEGKPLSGTNTRQKPFITAPNGINTTVDFHAFNLEGDADPYPNFYGTSAAAPHAAAVAALLIEGRQAFLNQPTTPDDVKSLIQNSAIDMGVPGPDTATGYGFIDPFGAMQTFASPIPFIDSLVTASPVTRPVASTFTVTVKGKGLNTNTKVYFGGTELPTTFVNSETVTADIPPFIDNPPIQLFNPNRLDTAVTHGRLDGGFSDSLYFFPTYIKNVVITANDTTKLFGERLPAFTARVLVDGQPLASTTYTPEQLKLDSLKFSCTGNSTSPVFNYVITPSIPLDPSLPRDTIYTNHFSYEFHNGTLTVQRLPITIVPRDTTLIYGQRIHGIHYNFTIDTALTTLQNPDSFKTAINLTYTQTIVDSLLVLINGGTVSKSIINTDLDNLGILVSGGTTTTSRSIINTGSGTTEISYIVDVAGTTLVNYKTDPATGPLVNGGVTTTSRTMINTTPLINGTANVLINGGTTSKSISNGDGNLLNSENTGGTGLSNIAVIISDPDVAGTVNPIFAKPANLATGMFVGQNKIAPAAFLSANLKITYHTGNLTILKAPLTIKANTAYTDNGVLPAFTSTITGYQFQDAATPKTGPNYTIIPAYNGKAGVYTIRPSNLTFSGDSNYNKVYTDGTLYVNPYNNGVRIHIYVSCVEKLKPNSPYGYIAHFYGSNKNSTPYYVPLGPDNFLSSAGKFKGDPPVLFPPGNTNFTIPFDGTPLTWTLKTKEKNVKYAEVTTAYTTSPKCTGSNSIAYADIESITDIRLPASMEIFPNPAKNRLIVTSDKPFESEKDVTVLDIYGRILSVHSKLKAAQEMELNISGLSKGSYFVRIKQAQNIKIMSFIKL